MSTKFADYMTSRFIKDVNPKRGDFFLTMSQTGANSDVRRLSGSKYGHAILYLGNTKKTDWKIGDKDFTFPTSGSQRLAFELPLNLKSIEHILVKDKCFGIAHVSPKSLSKKQQDKLFSLCAGFAFAKKDEGPRGGYSDRMAYYYAVADAFVNATGGALMGNNDNLMTDLQRFGPKMVNATVQSLVQISNGYPNLNCSSLVAWLYKEIGKSITTFSTTTSPGDLYNAVKKSGQFTVKEITFDRYAAAPGSRGSASVVRGGAIPLSH